jgi:hypothetical protein
MEQTEKTYRAKFAISQSSIKDWKELPPQKWYDKWILKIGKKKISVAMDFGSLLDTLCFSEKEFKKRFIVSELAVYPSVNVIKIVTEVYEEIKALNENIKTLNDAPAEEGMDKVIIPSKKVSLVDNKDIVKKVALTNDFYASKPDQAYNTIIDKGTEYFEFLKKVGKRIVITQIQLDLAKQLKEILFTDKVTAGFFTAKKGCRVIFQVQIFTDFPIDGYDNLDSLPIKGMVDIIHFNDKRKEVREVDLKFTNDVYKFNDYKGPVRMFDYPGQHSFYDSLIAEWLKTFEDGKYKDYSIMNPLNVVIDDDTKLPYLYEYNKTDLHIKRFGIEGTSIRGWEDVLNEIAWHLSNNDWTRPKDHIVNGKLLINIFNKK